MSTSEQVPAELVSRDATRTDIHFIPITNDGIGRPSEDFCFDMIARAGSFHRAEINGESEQHTRGTASEIVVDPHGTTDDCMEGSCRSSSADAVEAGYESLPARADAEQGP